MIEEFIEKWHKYLKGQLPGGLDELLAEDVTFYSPVVYTPQEGREITKETPSITPTTYIAQDPDDSIRARRDQVIDAVNKGGINLVNSVCH